MSVSLRAAVQIGKDYTAHLRSTKNQHLEICETVISNDWGVWSRIRQKLPDWPRLTGSQPMWRETTLLTDRAVQFATAQNLRLFWLGAVSGRYQWRTSRSLEKTASDRFFETRYLKDADRINVEPMEFEWTCSQDSPHWELLYEIQKMMNQSVNQSNSKERSSSCQCTMILMGENEDIEKIVLRMLSKLLSMLVGFTRGTLVVSGAWIREEMVRNQTPQTGWIMG